MAREKQCLLLMAQGEGTDVANRKITPTVEKGQCQQPDINQFDRRTQNKLLEQKRRDSLKNSIDNLKNALPDGRNLTDQTQQSVLLKAQNYIKDMLGKQQRNKTCMEDIETLKSKNSTMEDSIAMLKQEYDILSNMECNLGPP
ncbi:uncharacterized protein LOC117290482 [Asterias rubens]|uniref:uncharacterized protein LOC117290482 n=1 Tax=Asterias rubens TaxID=7604 RepID=UPI0014555405|nr:uncharacterized protein LOC117290482 [Asterias rubens]